MAIITHLVDRRILYVFRSNARALHILLVLRAYYCPIYKLIDQLYIYSICDMWVRRVASDCNEENYDDDGSNVGANGHWWWWWWWLFLDPIVNSQCIVDKWFGQTANTRRLQRNPRSCCGQVTHIDDVLCITLVDFGLSGRWGAVADRRKTIYMVCAITMSLANQARIRYWFVYICRPKCGFSGRRSAHPGNDVVGRPMCFPHCRDVGYMMWSSECGRSGWVSVERHT